MVGMITRCVSSGSRDKGVRMETGNFVKQSKTKLAYIAKLLVAGREKDAVTAFDLLTDGIPTRTDPRITNLLAGLVVSSVRAQQDPRKFEDPLTAFEDPLTAFEDPLTAFEDPLTAFKNPDLQKLTLKLISIGK